MTLRRYLQLDVFADRPGAGNPLAVVLDAQDLDEAAMQAFAAWTNPSETIFLLPPGPRAHPSVGAAWAVLDSGLASARDGALVQQCAAGHLPVTIDDQGDGRVVGVRAPRARRREPAAGTPALLHAAPPGLPRGESAPALWDNRAQGWAGAAG